MKYEGEKNYKHGSKERLGILITNLGTPDRPNKKAVKIYLKEFLSDPRVIEIPKLIWQIILRGIILNVRPRKVAKLYKSIWSKNGGPLLVMLKKQKKGIQKNLKQKRKDVKIEIYPGFIDMCQYQVHVKRYIPFSEVRSGKKRFFENDIFRFLAKPRAKN